MEAELDVGGDPLLERVEPQLFQPPDLALRELLARQVGEGGAAPERERRPEQFRPLRGGAARACARSPSKRTASIASGSTANDVAGCPRLDDVGSELAPELGDGVLE